jgi:hypothetical protein
MPAVPLLTYYSRYRRRMVERADGERRRRRVRGPRSGQATPSAVRATDTAPTPRAVTASATTPAASVAPSPPKALPVTERPSDTRRRRPDQGREREREPYDSHQAVPVDDHERGLRGLIGGGSSQVSVEAAMRARDSARPTDADIAQAEETLTIVHRGWVPRDA